MLQRLNAGDFDCLVAMAEGAPADNWAVDELTQQRLCRRRTATASFLNFANDNRRFVHGQRCRRVDFEDAHRRLQRRRLVVERVLEAVAVFSGGSEAPEHSHILYMDVSEPLDVHRRRFGPPPDGVALAQDSCVVDALWPAVSRPVDGPPAGSVDHNGRAARAVIAHTKFEHELITLVVVELLLRC